jgi:predicted amidohydrolase
MIAYRQYATVQESKQIILSDLPFQPGQRVEIVVLAEEERPVNLVRELREVLQVTQALPQAQAISEDKIAAESAAYRAADR